MNEITFDGYLAELIALLAERAGVTPEEFVVSLFANGCNALGETDATSSPFSAREVQCTNSCPMVQCTVQA